MTTGKFDDGGSAFPYGQLNVTTGQPIAGVFETGRSLADEFAKASMSLAADSYEGVGMPMVCAKLGIEVADYNADVHWPMLVARRSYDFAAAMVAEKRRREGGGT